MSDIDAYISIEGHRLAAVRLTYSLVGLPVRSLTILRAVEDCFAAAASLERLTSGSFFRAGSTGRLSDSKS